MSFPRIRHSPDGEGGGNPGFLIPGFRVKPGMTK